MFFLKVLRWIFGGENVVLPTMITNDVITTLVDSAPSLEKLGVKVLGRVKMQTVLIPMFLYMTEIPMGWEVKREKSGLTYKVHIFDRHGKLRINALIVYDQYRPVQEMQIHQ